jgi:hemerythrin-like domain-containing protein
VRDDPADAARIERSEESLMKATDILSEQHREVLALIRRINGGRDVARRPMLVDTLIGHLRVHTGVEERIFYPAIAERKGDAEAMVLESYEEHRIVDSLLLQLPAMDPSSDAFEARMRVLESLLAEHIEEEEETMFPLAERLGEETLIELGSEIERELEEVARVNELLDRAASAAERTEGWAGRLLDLGFLVPRQAVSRFAPSRLLGLDRRGMLVASIADRVPRWLVDGVYGLVGGNGNGRRHRPETESGRRMAQSTDLAA